METKYTLKPSMGGVLFRVTKYSNCFHVLLNG